MKRPKNSTLLVVLACLLLAFSPGCKSKKKAMEASNAEKEKAKIEAEARQKQEEEARRKEAEEKEREAARLREEALAKEKASAPSVRLSQYFQSIASSANTQAANNSITEALTLFTSPDVPVLIVISEEAGQKDYDRPTTIKDYLNYLKDQKKNMNSISGLKVDSAGKITEVELRKSL